MPFGCSTQSDFVVDCTTLNGDTSIPADPISVPIGCIISSPSSQWIIVPEVMWYSCTFLSKNMGTFLVQKCELSSIVVAL